MDSFLKSDIFFVVTTLVVVALGALIGWALVYIIHILSDVKKISHKVEQEGEKIVDDLSLLRENVKQETIRLSSFLSFFFPRKKQSQKKKITKDI
jgi:hypothetical protein